MKNLKLIATIPLAAALTTGLAYAQGNPHKDMLSDTQKVARFQGNPHLGFEMETRYVNRYRGNPHEGYITQVSLVAQSQGNPHVGFKIIPLTVVSAQYAQ